MNNTFNKYISFYFILFLLVSCSRNKKDSELFFIQGNEAFRKGDFEKATQFFSEAIEKTPDFSDAYNNRGLALMKQEKYDEAKKDFEKAVNLDNGFVLAKYNLAETEFYLNNLDESLAMLESIEHKFKDSTDFYSIIGAVYASKNNFSKATASLNKAILLNRKAEKAYVNLGFVQYQERNFKEAKANFDKAISLNPKQDFALNNLSLIEAQNENFEKAIEFAKKAIDINSTSIIYKNNLAFYLLSENKLNEGKVILDEISKKEPQNAWILRNYGIYFLKNVEYRKSRDYFVNAEQIDPSVELIYYFLGISEQKLDRNPCKYWKIGEKLNDKKSIEMLSKFCK